MDLAMLGPYSFLRDDGDLYLGGSRERTEVDGLGM